MDPVLEILEKDARTTPEEIAKMTKLKKEEVKKRKKKLSKAIFGTSHIVSLDEAKHIYEKGARKIIIGSGQSEMVKLSKEAEDYFSRKKCMVSILPTEEAIQSWNDSEKKIVGMFHVTC